MRALTDRDVRILAAIAAGKSNGAIGRAEGLAAGRIGNIRTQIYRTLGAVNGANAVDIADRGGESS